MLLRILNLSHHCSVATDILFVTVGQTENHGGQFFCLSSVFLHLASLLIQLILIAVSVGKK